jgi:23S rRNA (guanine745-N1)-methyltransferase
VTTILCTVRGCQSPLTREERRLVCPRGHSFDVARSGYVNLLQPQDSKSRNPGDTAAAVTARRRLHDRGVTAPLLQAIADVAAPARSDTILDAGCGDGFYLASLAGLSGAEGLGIDISIPAIDAAARRYPECAWLVANADRFIPCHDGAFSLVTSITARMNPAEFNRVLRPDGRLLIALPAPYDIAEIRGEGRDAPHFGLISQTRTTTHADLDAAGVEDVLHAIYRPMRSEPSSAMRITFSLDLLLFRPRN